MNEENKEGLDSNILSDNSRRIGIATILPTEVREILTNAAAEATQYDEGSLKRKRIIDNAISRVRLAYPEYFRGHRG